jgi:hypothetical protein
MPFGDTGLHRALGQDPEVMTARLGSSIVSTARRQMLERTRGVSNF